MAMGFFQILGPRVAREWEPLWLISFSLDMTMRMFRHPVSHYLWNNDWKSLSWSLAVQGEFYSDVNLNNLLIRECPGIC